MLWKEGEKEESGRDVESKFSVMSAKAGADCR
jgi:hypothetical protein